MSNFIKGMEDGLILSPAALKAMSDRATIAERNRWLQAAREPSDRAITAIHVSAEPEATANRLWLPYSVIRAVLTAFAEEMGKGES